MKRLVTIMEFLWLSIPVSGQQLSGRIEGVVMDAQGAVIPGTAVVATHEETRSVYNAKTSGLGAFVMTNVRLGRFTVTAEAPGFRRAIVNDVIVEVGGTAALTIRMEVGLVQESLTVSAESTQVQLNTSDAELSTVVDNRRVLELPLNGRNAAELALQQAGVYYERDADGMGDKFIVHGQRHRAINMTLDGIDTQDNYNRASSIMLEQPLLAMTSENVQEFRVVTGLSSAEYSRGAAQISAVTRSGTNRFRGSLFWFNRNDYFGANEFFNNSAQPKVETPPLNRNQFGGRIGGPIRKDKTFFYLGYQQTREARGIPVNRTVYTADARQGVFRYLDGLRNTPENVAANPDRIRSVNLLGCGGNLSSLLRRDCVDSRFNLLDRPALDPFINNDVFGLIPLPNNFDLGDGLNTGGFRFNAKAFTVEHLPSIRLDHRLTERHNFYATFNYVDRNIQGDFINGREPPFPAQGPLSDRVTHSRGWSAALASTLAPTFVNEFRFGYLGGENAFLLRQPFATPYTLNLNTITDPYSPFNGDDARDNRTVHLRDVGNWIKGNHQFKAGIEWRERFVDTYSLDGVPPNIEVGFDDNDNPPGFGTADLNRVSGARAINSVDEETARDLMNNLVGAVGEVFERFNVSSIDSGFVPGQLERRIYKTHELDWFVNDTWRLRPNLTLNLGLRWEYASVPYETRGLALSPEGGLSAVFGVSGPGGFFNPGFFDGVPCASLGRLPMTVTTANATALIDDCSTRYTPATSTNGRPLWNDDRNNFAPVVSLAWDPFGDGKTSVRSGFRVSYMQDHLAIIEGNLDDNEGLVVTNSCAPSDGNCQTNATLLRNTASGAVPRPAAPTFRLPSSRSILDSSTIDFRTYDRNLGTPYYNEWTFGISRELSPNWALEARYVGNQGVGLRRVADYNEMNLFARDPESGQTFLDAFRIAQRNLDCNLSSGRGSRFDDASGAACIVSNPLMRDLIAGEAARLRSRTSLLTALERNQTGQFIHALTQVETSRPASGQARIRGGSFWGQVLAGRFPLNFFQANPFVGSARAMINDGFSTYHGVEIEVRRRFARGFSVQSNYTYGKALADYDGDANELLNDVRPSSILNPGYSRKEIVPRHQFNANWVYELPFGGGKALLNRDNLAQKIFGGWQLSGLLNWRSGRPLSVTSGAGTFHRNAISDENTVDLSQNVTADQIRALTGRRSIGSGLFWIDPCLSGFNRASCTAPGAIEGLFNLPAPGKLGDLGQTVLFGPRRFLLDASLLKRAPLTESSDLEFRWEVFNVFNNANFAAPTLDITSASFGQVIRTVSNSRLMQFALKINF